MHHSKLRAIVLFYRTFRLFSNALTLGLIAAFYPWLKEYIHLFIVCFLWFKLIANTGIWYLTRQMYKAQFWFYYNLGLSETVLFGGAFALDLLLGFGLIFSVYQILLAV